jgi:hypothetical protein
MAWLNKSEAPHHFRDSLSTTASRTPAPLQFAHSSLIAGQVRKATPIRQDHGDCDALLLGWAAVRIGEMRLVA